MSSPFTIDREQAEALAQSLEYGNKLTFSNLANRNWVAKIARQRRITVYKYSMRGQLLDPRYVCDSGITEDKGLGNDYKHYWKTLYMLEKARW